MQWFLTGQPGIGKTTICLQIAKILHSGGILCGGFVTREIREGTTRVGFEFVNIEDGETFLLATTNNCQGPRVGKYYVHLEGVARAVKIMESTKSNFVFLDEIGPLELKSPEFTKMTDQLLVSNHNALIVVHRNLAFNYPCIEVTAENRDILPEEIAGQIRNVL